MANIHVASAAMVDAIGQPGFKDAMIEACQSAVRFDSAVLLAFDSQGRRPFCLASRFAGPEIDVANELYFDKHFENCEVIERLQRKRGSGSLSLMRQSVDEIVDPEYRKDLYEAPGIAHDLMLLEQVGTMYFNLELFRSEGSVPFSEEEETRVREFWPLVLACIQKNARLAKLPKFTPSQRSEQLKSLVRMFLEKGVSSREAEVCAHIALGYSTLATSLHLAVSANTISTLRQRAYRKLGISCMNELFSLCLRSIDTTLGDVALGREYFEH